MTLKQYLAQHNIPPDRFAGELGVSIPTIYRYLSGDRFPTPDNLRRIRDMTGGAVTANDFLDQGAVAGAERGAA